MCGRFFLKDVPASAWADLGVSLPANAAWQNFNIAPSFTIPIALDSHGERVLTSAEWGLLPHWARDKKMRPQINARAESAATKPYFRSAFKHHRCLIPVSGFYEWRRDESGKTPFAIALPDTHLFAFAGLYELQEDADRPGFNCAILTTDANEQMQAVHNRMPVILHRENYGDWIAAGGQELLVPYQGDLTIWQISKDVNSPRNNQAGLLDPVT